MTTASEFVDFWAETAVRLTLFLMIATPLAAGFLWCFRRRISPGHRHLVWLLLLAVGICWFRLPIERPRWWPSFSERSKPMKTVAARQLIVVSETESAGSRPNMTGAVEQSLPPVGTAVQPPALDVSLGLSEADDRMPSNAASSPTPRHSSVQPEYTASNLAGNLFAIWMTGIGLLAAFMLHRLWRFRRFLRSVAYDPSLALEERFSQWRLEFSSGRRPLGGCRLRLSSNCHAPLVLGMVRPVIWLPDWFEELSKESQKAILAHEWAHIARRDVWAASIATVSRILNAFNPAVWWLGRALATDREAAADRWALERAGIAPAVHARALLDVASRMPAVVHASGAAMAQKPSALRRRVETILKRRTGSTAGAVPAGILGVAILLLALLVLAREPLGEPVTAGSMGEEPGGPARPFAVEIETYPDLAEVEMVLNRQPFQHPTSICSAVWADEGRSLVIACRSCVYVWDVATRRPTRRLPAHGVNYNHVAMSDDGKTLAVMGGITRIYDWPSLEVRSEIRVGAPDIAGDGAFALSPDGRYLALSYQHTGNHYELHVFDCANGKQMFQRKGPPMDAVAWAPGSEFLAVTEGRGIIIFLTPAGKLIRRGIRLEPIESPTAVDVSNDGKLLAVTTTESIGVYRVRGRERIWYHSPEKLNAKRPPHRYHHVQFTADGETIVARRYDRGFRSSFVTMGATSGKRIGIHEVDIGTSRVASLSPDGRMLAVEDRNNTVCLRDPETFEPIVDQATAWDRENMAEAWFYPTVLRASRGSDRLLGLGSDTLMQWNLESGKLDWSVTLPGRINDAAWMPDDAQIVTIRDKTASTGFRKAEADDELDSCVVELRDPVDGRVTRTTPLDDLRGGPVLALADGRIVACGRQHLYLLDADGKRVWKTRLCTVDEAGTFHACLSPDESRVAIVQRMRNHGTLPNRPYAQGSIFVVDVADGKMAHELFSQHTPQLAAFRADGRRVFASTNNHPRRRGQFQPLIEMWDLGAGDGSPIEANEHDWEARPSFNPYPQEDVQRILAANPLVASQRSIVEGPMAVDSKRRWLLIDKPFSYPELRDSPYPHWSGRAMVWDLEKEELKTSWVLPGFSGRAYAVLPDNRFVTLNSNGTIYVFASASWDVVGEEESAGERAADPARPVQIMAGGKPL